MPGKASRQARDGRRFPTTGAVRTARFARNQISHSFEKTRKDWCRHMSDYKLFRCIQCGFDYDEALGWPEDGIEPGTRWDDIPEDWSCPDCGAAKSDFEMVEVARP
jgi:rubredoxin